MGGQTLVIALGADLERHGDATTLGPSSQKTARVAAEVAIHHHCPVTCFAGHSVAYDAHLGELVCKFLAEKAPQLAVMPNAYATAFSTIGEVRAAHQYAFGKPSKNPIRRMIFVGRDLHCGRAAWLARRTLPRCYIGYVTIGDIGVDGGGILLHEAGAWMKIGLQLVTKRLRREETMS